MEVTSIAIPDELKLVVLFDLRQYKQTTKQNLSHWLFKPSALVSVFTLTENQQKYYKLSLPNTAPSANSLTVRKEPCSTDNACRGRDGKAGTFFNDSVFCLVDKFNSDFENYDTKVTTVYAGFHKAVSNRNFKLAYPDAYQTSLTSTEPSKMMGWLSDKNARIYSDIRIVPSFRALQSLDEILSDESIVDLCGTHCKGMLKDGYKGLKSKQKKIFYKSGKLPRIFKEAFP